MFESFDDFLAMGGYGAFVWASYGLCFGGMLILLVQSLATSRKRRQELQHLEGSQTRQSRKRDATVKESR